MAYSIQEGYQLLDQARAIRSALEHIQTIDEGKIVNEVGVEHFPFGKSLDELYQAVVEWVDDIQMHVEGGN